MDSNTATAPPPRVTIDVTDLPPHVRAAVQTLVDAYRDPHRPSATDPDEMPAPRQPLPPPRPREQVMAGWAELRAYLATRPVTPSTMDDSRESIYEGCGE